MASRLKRNKKVIGETLAELDANAGHLSETSRSTSVPVSTLHFWRDNYSNDPLVERYRKLKNEELADRFRVVAAKAIERLNAEIDSVKVDNLMVMAATGADKQLLLTGQATSITHSKDDSAHKLTALLNEAGINIDESRAREIMSASFKRAGITENPSGSVS